MWLLCCLVLFGLVPSTVPSCPTMGSTSFILLTVTPKVDVDDFATYLEFYSKLTPYRSNVTSKYTFYFGSNNTQVLNTGSLQEDLYDWITDRKRLESMYNSSVIGENGIFLNNSDELTGAAKGILGSILSLNQDDQTIVEKKQIVLLTDYVPLQVTQLFKENVYSNTQVLGIWQTLDVSILQSALNATVVSMEEEDETRMRNIFQKDIDFEFPTSIYASPPLSHVQIFSDLNDTTGLLNIVTNAATSAGCQLTGNKLTSDFVTINYNGVTEKLPWVGASTVPFADYCIKSLETKNSSNSLFLSFTGQLKAWKNVTSYIFYVTNSSDTIDTDMINIQDEYTFLRIVTSEHLDNVYDDVTYKLKTSGVLNASLDQQILQNNQFYLLNHSTTCADTIPFVPLSPSRPWHRPKYLSIALDDILWITIFASISVTTVGIFIYAHVIKKQKRQAELLTEIMLQPRLYNRPPEYSRTDRLPWEVNEENIDVDVDYMLGEGTVSNVFLGKLKGKSPIMNWINRVEIKQFQDCPVAVRVPRRNLNESEENQLQREITSMRKLRHHQHIAMFLGWTNLDGLICSLLELTHMNLVKYLIQIKQTVDTTENPTEALIPKAVLMKMLWEVCDGMAYIHTSPLKLKAHYFYVLVFQGETATVLSNRFTEVRLFYRNLVHRDLTARNILLTSELKVKISGFGFCSEPEDAEFHASSTAIRYLPIRWLAPECYQGVFTAKTDCRQNYRLEQSATFIMSLETFIEVQTLSKLKAEDGTAVAKRFYCLMPLPSWAFGCLMYEVFSLGGLPYSELTSPEEIIEEIKKKKPPSRPEHASKQIYKLMLDCFHRFSLRRPSFNRLREFFLPSHTSYVNPAFQK